MTEIANYVRSTEKIRQIHNRLDRLEDIADFYGYSTRRLLSTDIPDKKLIVFRDIQRGRIEKILDGTVDPGYSEVRLPKKTNRIIFEGNTSVSVCSIHLMQPCKVTLHNEASSALPIRMKCLGSGPEFLS